jgi:hypothetical protein
MVDSLSRRTLLFRTLQISVGGALASTVASRASAAQCVDLQAMDPGDQSTRMGLHWVAMTPNPEQPCAKCAFFTATTGGCGNCAIFNGPTALNGHCDSWSAKTDATQ